MLRLGIGWSVGEQCAEGKEGFGVSTHFGELVEVGLVFAVFGGAERFGHDFGLAEEDSVFLSNGLALSFSNCISTPALLTGGEVMAEMERTSH